MIKTVEKSHAFDKLLEKHKLYKCLRITAWIKRLSWIKRFVSNCQKTKRSGSLKTDEIEHQVNSGFTENNSK